MFKLVKNRKFFLTLLFSFVCLNFFAVQALAAIIPSAEQSAQEQAEAKDGTIWYWPNIHIPGMERLFTEAQIVEDPITKEKHTVYKVNNSAFANYIRVLYRYAGIIAGAFAMFMLVYGAWQWLMAAGNASKIAMAKETVSTTLVGLAFLFGGYLLLSQISTSLVNFQPLSISKVNIKDFCSTHTDQAHCAANDCLWLAGAAQNADQPASGSCIAKSSGPRCEVENILQNITIISSNFAISPSCSDPRLTPDSAGALIRVTGSLRGTERIILTSAFRSWAVQEKLYKCSQNCTSDCTSCNEAAEPSCQAPHQTGRAVDVCYQDSSRNIDTCPYMKAEFNCWTSPSRPGCNQKLYDGQRSLRQHMMDQGFVPYDGEWWHFQHST